MSYEMEHLAEMVRRVGYVEGRTQLRREILDRVASLALTDDSSDSDYRKAFIAIMDTMIESISVEDLKNG